MLPRRQPSSRATSGTRSGGTTCGALRSRHPTGANQATWPVAPSSGASPSAHPVGRWMRTKVSLHHTTIVKLGAVLAALAIPVPAAAAQEPAPGGLGYADADAPSVFADGSTLLA